VRLERSQEGEELVVGRPPVLADRHPAAGGYPAGLGQRELDVQRVLERVEAGDHVERAVGPRQLLHEIDAEVARGHAAAGLGDPVGQRVNPVHRGAARGRELAEAAATAADIEDPGTGADARHVGDRGPRGRRRICVGGHRLTLSYR
jgi:hypothetical protein